MNKSKLTLTITAMALVTMIAVVSIIAVFAARTQNFSSNVSVKYTATQIAGKVSAKYYVGPTDTSGTDMTTTGKADGATELVFRPGDKQLSENTLNPQGDIVLDIEDTSANIPDKSFVVFEYRFQNGLNDETVDTSYMAKLTAKGVSDNIAITVKESNSKITDFSEINGKLSGMDYYNENNLDTIGKCAFNDLAYQLAVGETSDYSYFYIKAEIENFAIDSTFSGSFNWELSLLKPTLDKLTFTLVDDHYAVKQKDENVSGDIVIPKTYTGEDGIERPVTVIGEGQSYFMGSAFTSANITSLYIPEGIEVIGDMSCAACGASEITIPESVKTIGGLAFNGMPNLRLVKYYAINAEVLGSAFGILGSALFSSPRDTSNGGLAIIIGDNVTNIPQNLIGWPTFVSGHDPSYALNITNVTIGKNVENIAIQAFRWCEYLYEIAIPASVKTIGDGAFNSCTRLMIVTIDSPEIYSALDNSSSDGDLSKLGVITFNVLASIDDGSNIYFTRSFTQTGTKKINGKLYNVYERYN